MGMPNLDLQQLALLQMLLATASVTETARRLDKTQPVVSRELAKLREVFQDLLLLRVGKHLAPTPYARALNVRLDRAMVSLQALMTDSETFDPEQARMTYVLACSDHVAGAQLNSFFEELNAQCPGIVLRVQPLGSSTIGQLTRDEVQLAIAPHAPMDGIDDLVFRPFDQDPFVCVMRKGHPLCGKRLTLKRYLQERHVAVGTERPAASPVDLALAQLGKKREVRLVLPSFAAVLAHVEKSDSVAVVPQRVARTHSHLTTHVLPFELEPFELHLVWHPRWTTDPAHLFVRELLLQFTLGRTEPRRVAAGARYRAH